jgi:hypothetical protein
VWRAVEDVGKAGGSASLPARAFDWRLADHRKHARSTSGMTALAIRVPTTPHLLARLGEIKTTSDAERPRSRHPARSRSCFPRSCMRAGRRLAKLARALMTSLHPKIPFLADKAKRLTSSFSRTGVISAVPEPAPIKIKNREADRGCEQDLNIN